MKILLTNDDGFGSDGIRIMEETLIKAGHDVWVFAPESQRSAKSHSITIRHPIRIYRHHEKHFLCEGSPADCVLYPLLTDFGMGRPDVVVSGINDGFNISADIIYSGTVGAAREAAFNHIPAIAVSAFEGEKGSYQDAADFVVEHFDNFVSLCTDGTVINVNVPCNAHGEWEVCCSSSAEFYSHVVEETSKGFYTFTGDAHPEFVTDIKKGSDFEIAAIKNKIAVSALDVVPAVKPEVQQELRKLK